MCFPTFSSTLALASLPGVASISHVAQPLASSMSWLCLLHQLRALEPAAAVRRLPLGHVSRVAAGRALRGGRTPHCAGTLCAGLRRAQRDLSEAGASATANTRTGWKPGQNVERHHYKHK